MGRTTLKMPQLGESVTEGTVDRWLKQEGDMVRRDEPIVEVVTDKVNAEIPSPFEGRLVRIDVQPGQTVPIGAALAEMEVEGATPAAPAAPAPKPAEPRSEPPRAAAAPAAATEHARVSPAVRKLVQDHDLDLSQIPGTGPGGRVTREDVQAYLASKPAPATAPTAARTGERGDELVRISTVRRQIAEHMVRSVSTSPQTGQKYAVSGICAWHRGHSIGAPPRPDPGPWVWDVTQVPPRGLVSARSMAARGVSVRGFGPRDRRRVARGLRVSRRCG